MGDDSEFSLEEVKIRAFNKPKEKIEFWEDIKGNKNEGILVNFGNDKNAKLMKEANQTVEDQVF
jgi:hypothetical protein